MKKLTVLVVIMLVAILLAGCWVLPESKLEFIEADPAEIEVILGPSGLAIEEVQLEVTAFYEDDTYADVTSNCEYSLDNTEFVTVSDEGLVRVEPIVGEATILITYTQHNFWTGRVIKTTEVDVTVKY